MSNRRPDPVVILVRLSRSCWNSRCLRGISRSVVWFRFRFRPGQRVGGVPIGHNRAGDGQSQFAGELRQKKRTVGMVKPVLGLHMYPTASAQSPEHRTTTSAGPASAPSVNRMVHQQSVQRGTGSELN